MDSLLVSMSYITTTLYANEITNTPARTLENTKTVVQYAVVISSKLEKATHFQFFLTLQKPEKMRLLHADT